MIDEWVTATGMVEDVKAGSSGARSLSANADGKHGHRLDRLDPSADLFSGPSAERRSVAQVLPIMIMSLLTLCYSFVGLAAAGFVPATRPSVGRRIGDHPVSRDAAHTCPSGEDMPVFMSPIPGRPQPQASVHLSCSFVIAVGPHGKVD